MIASLDSAIRAAAREAAESWPTVRIDPESFLRHVAERLPEPTEAALVELHLDDLYLACACMQGNAAAWKVFSKMYLARVGEYVARIDRQQHFADEITQILAEKLLRDQHLGRYRGKGPIGAWLRVVAVREAQSVVRQRSAAAPASHVPVRDPSHDPEVQFFKQRYAREFEAAFVEVLATLSVDERTVLKLHYLDGLTLEQVGRTYLVSRATAARWIASARDSITERVRTNLAGRLGDESPSPESVLELVHSQLHLSFMKNFT